MLRRSSLVECVSVLPGNRCLQNIEFFFLRQYVQPCLLKNPKYTFYTIKSSLKLAYYDPGFVYVNINIVYRNIFYFRYFRCQNQLSEAKGKVCGEYMVNLIDTDSCQMYLETFLLGKFSLYISYKTTIKNISYTVTTKVTACQILIFVSPKLQGVVMVVIIR